MKHIRLLVISVGICAGLTSALVYRWQPVVDDSAIVAVSMLAFLAVLAEAMSFVLPRSAKGSIAFIPYLAAVMVVPAWPTIVAAAAVKLSVELLSRRESIKRIFNVVQLVFALGCAVLVFRAFGGVGMLSDGISSLASTTGKSGLPALVAFVATFVVNSALVNAAIALANGYRVRQLLRENVAPSIAFDILASPIVFVFAWVYAEHGAIAALAVWSAIVGFRQLTKANLELEQTNQELLQLMIKSIEARDPYTSGHSRRVETFAVLIARAMRLPEREVIAVGRAALLHDVGKIYEKYAPILAKTDRLTPEEWVVMQQHPIDGAELVTTMTRLRDLVPAIRHHHERWDGGGYPDQLARVGIPLAARIIAIADTIDAMTSQRPYRTALDERRVRDELVRCRARQFDPVIVDRLLSDSTTWEKIFGPGRAPAFGAPLTVVRSSQAAG